MKWPFARTEKEALKETTRLLATPPRPRAVSKLGVPDDLRKTQALPVKDTIPTVNVGVGTTIPVRFSAILPQVSGKLFLHDVETELTDLTIDVPASLVVPQLNSGRVKVDWADLVPLIPANLLKRPAPPGVDQPSVTLPMGEIVAAIPPDAFTLQGTEPADLNSTDFEDLPQLFDDAFFEEALPATAAASAPVAPKPAPEPVMPVVKPVQKPWVSAESVFIALRNLVSGMPDNVFARPRTELWQIADPNTEIALPAAPLLPLLGSAHLTLPLDTVIQVMPPELFVTPLPDLTGQVVPLPLHEVIRQLPPSLFSIQAKGTAAQPVDPNDSNIPEPFREKSPAPAAETTPAPAESIEAIAEEPPTAAELPVVEEVPVAAQAAPAELDEAALADESFALFAEKTPAAAAPVEESPAPIEPVVAPAPVEAKEEEPVVIEQPAPIEPVTTAAPEPSSAVLEPLSAETTEPAEMAASEQKPVPTNEFLINLNRCTFEDLQLIDGVGPALAKRIIDYRNTNGAFQSVYELRNVPGIGRKTFRALAGVPMRRLNRFLGVEHDQELSLPEIMRLISALPGVEGCVLTTNEGLPLTGNLPPQFDQERFSVFAPQLFKKLGRCTRELSVGDVNRLTLFTDAQPLSIFRAGTIFLVVVHNPDRFSKALLRRCTNICEELARLCRQRAAV